MPASLFGLLTQIEQTVVGEVLTLCFVCKFHFNAVNITFKFVSLRIHLFHHCIPLSVSVQSQKILRFEKRLLTIVGLLT